MTTEHDALFSTESAHSNETIASTFASIVHKYGRSVALSTPTATVTYSALDQVATNIAESVRWLDNPEKRVYLLFQHDAPMIYGLIGALKAGCAYIPLDPSHPAARLRFILEDSQGTVLLTNTSNLDLANHLSAGMPALRIINIDEVSSTGRSASTPVHEDPHSHAYILYTSGSTGHPKGVMQSNRNVLYFIRNYTENLSISADDRLTLFSTYGFDAAVMDIFAALLNGATLSIYDVKKTGAVNSMADWLRKERITIFHSVPTLFRYFIKSLTETCVFDGVRYVVMGGEPVLINDFEVFRRHFSKSAIFVNGLGPTESTVTLQYFMSHGTEITSASVPVGYPIRGTQVYVLHKDGSYAGVGEPGELVYRSDHLALGYLNQDEKTSAAFVTDPVVGSGRAFRSGDLGRRTADGCIEFVGREDSQVKVRGYRVELSEIESVLDRHPEIDKSAVMPSQHSSAQPQILAYYTSARALPISGESLDLHLRSRVPDYMVPNSYIFLDEFPLTPTGKIDRRFLVENFTPLASNDQTTPRTPTEATVRSVWQGILKHGDFGMHTQFALVGGNSLMSTDVALQLQEHFDIEIPLSDIAILGTIAQLADYIDGELRS